MADFYFAESLGEEEKSAAAIIALLWPDCIDLFHREMKLYWEFRDVFAPYFVLAKDDEGLAGFALLTASQMSTDLQTMTWVAVRPDAQGKGIGRELVTRCMNEASRRGETIVLTTSSPEFYLKLGFRQAVQYDSKKNRCVMISERNQLSFSE